LRLRLKLVEAEPGLARVIATLPLYNASYRQTMRDDFGYFRQHMRPGMLWGFWNEVVATELTEFYAFHERLAARFLQGDALLGIFLGRGHWPRHALQEPLARLTIMAQ
jgi:hypothetical protein